MITQHKSHLQPYIDIIAKPFLSWNPSVLTLLSLLSAVVFFIGIVTHIYWLSMVSIAGFVFDVLDGHVARMQNKVTAFGGFFDSFCDRIADFFFFVGFGVVHLVSWELVVLIIFTSFLISYMRSRGDLAFNLGHASVEGLMQRPQRIVLLLLGFFLFLLFPTFQVGIFSLLTFVFGIIFIFNCVTIVQRFIFFAQK